MQSKEVSCHSFSSNYLNCHNSLYNSSLSSTAPLDIGPGSYLLDKADLKGIERFKPMKFQPKESNWASLPRFTQVKQQTSD